MHEDWNFGKMESTGNKGHIYIMHKQEGPEALNRSPEYIGQKSNI